MTALMGLSLFWVLNVKTASLLRWGFNLGIFLIAVTCHSSHVFILGIIFIYVIFISLLQKNRELTRRATLMGFVSVCIWFSQPLIHLYWGNSFTFVKDSALYFVGRINDHGILDDLLLEKDPNKQIELSHYIHQFPQYPNGLIWDKNTPILKIPEEQLKEDLIDTIKLFFESPKYIAKFSAYGLRDAWILFSKSDFTYAPWKIANPQIPIYAKKVGKSHFHQYLGSKQNNKEFSLKYLNMIAGTLFFVSLIVYPVLLFVFKTALFQPFFSSYFVVFIVANDIITGMLSIPIARYHSRVSWLGVLAVFLMLAIIVDRKLPKKSRRLKSTN